MNHQSSTTHLAEEQGVEALEVAVSLKGQGEKLGHYWIDGGTKEVDEDRVEVVMELGSWS